MSKIPDIEPYTNKGDTYYKYKNWLEEMFFSATCAYCLIHTHPRSWQIDHYRPRKRFPREALDPDNLLISCSSCNRCKSDFFDEHNPEIIFNCRKEDISEFVALDETTGKLIPKKSVQKKTKERVLFNIRRFKLNRLEYQNARKDLVDFLREVETHDTGNIIINFLSKRYLLFHVLDVKIEKTVKRKILKKRDENIATYRKQLS